MYLAFSLLTWSLQYWKIQSCTGLSNHLSSSAISWQQLNQKIKFDAIHWFSAVILLHFVLSFIILEKKKKNCKRRTIIESCCDLNRTIKYQFEVKKYKCFYQICQHDTEEKLHFLNCSYSKSFFWLSSQFKFSSNGGI